MVVTEWWRLGFGFGLGFGVEWCERDHVDIVIGGEILEAGFCVEVWVDGLVEAIHLIELLRCRLRSGQCICDQAGVGQAHGHVGHHVVLVEVHSSQVCYTT